MTAATSNTEPDDMPAESGALLQACGTRRGRRAFLAGLAAACALPGSVAALPQGQPSRTALSTAMQRAAHQLIERPLVFEDPFALAMIGARRVRWLASNLERFRSPGAAALRAALVLRSRFAEDELARALAAGCRQCVVLGAGLDTLALRSPHPGLRIFEVDHPATQAWKLGLMREHGLEAGRGTVHVPVDFETESLARRLAQAGLRRDRPVFFTWLGVTMYLSRDAVMQTLSFAARDCARGSEIVFDYALPDSRIDPRERAARARLAERVEQAGEPWISQFDPEALAEDLRRLGFSQIDDLDRERANRRYFDRREDGFAVRGASQVMSART
jgi:methyltransferase (TIGR00027 family)